MKSKRSKQDAASRTQLPVDASKSQSSSETRELILVTAEQLFAQHGVEAVSNRRISEASGQANNSAVGYHFGTQEDLVLAIVGRHAESIEQRRAERLALLSTSSELRDWVACLVRPMTEHLAAQDHPTWYAQFIAQVMTHPALRTLVVRQTTAAQPLQQTIRGMLRLVPQLPRAVQKERSDMSRLLIVHSCAERERALHAGTATARATWSAAANGLIDALLGLWLAPVWRRHS